eukprot:357033-Chlamydomonas_euryale.AAC.13
MRTQPPPQCFFPCPPSTNKAPPYISTGPHIEHELHNTSPRPHTLSTKPGVSMMVRLGQCANSTFITIGLEDTSAPPSLARYSCAMRGSLDGE